MDFSSYPNASIAGSGRIGGGTYNEVECSGSATVDGNIKCAEFSASGSSKVHGNTECYGDIDVSGASKFEGDVDCYGTVDASGSLSIGGNLKCRSLDASGSIKVSKNVNAEDIDTSGAFDVVGDCEGENVELSGIINIGGLLNGENIDIHLDGFGAGCSKIGQIGGGQVEIHSSHRILHKLFGRTGSGQELVTSLIEADRVEIENTFADTVRAVDAIIGDGCEVALLEYSGEIEISENAKVEKIVKI